MEFLLNEKIFIDKIFQLHLNGKLNGIPFIQKFFLSITIKWKIKWKKFSLKNALKPPYTILLLYIIDLTVGFKTNSNNNA